METPESSKNSMLRKLSSHILGWLTLLTASLLGIVALALFRRKEIIK